MMKKIKLLWRALVFVVRDMFIGFLVAAGATLIMFRLNPDMYGVIALLLPVGILAGIFKGIVKFIFLNVSSALPSKGYRFDYPKYKLLGFWIIALLGSFLFAYGTDLALWVSGPLDMLENNIVLGALGKRGWIYIIGLIHLMGIAAHIYEPPHNEDESLPPEEDEPEDPD